eukprot:gene31806-36470_t
MNIGTTPRQRKIAARPQAAFPPGGSTLLGEIPFALPYIRNEPVGVMGFFDIYSIAFLVIAVAIIWKLRSVLGTKTGTERPPVDRYAPPRADAPDLRTGGDNVVPIARPPQPGAETVPGTAPDPSVPPPVPSALDAALRLLAQADGTFDQAHFITGAKAAYEMIVTAFATGDRRTLKPLLSRDVLESFSPAIAARERDRHP